MKIILLSGGSGQRLWPLSNSTRSKQFLRLLPAPNGSTESMLQRVFRQIEEAHLTNSITVATSAAQRDSITTQIGNDITLVTEPERRGTFPAIALATAHLLFNEKCDKEEVAVVIPCDTYTDAEYFCSIRTIAEVVANNDAELALVGIMPTAPSSKYGYIQPAQKDINGIQMVKRFTEKPSKKRAEQLIANGALWNGGVFAFKLGFIEDIINRYMDAASFEEVQKNYCKLPAVSFDNEVTEKCHSVAVATYHGKWKDLASWKALSEELPDKHIGNIMLGEGVENTTIINELELPLVCNGIKDAVVVAGYEGVLVCSKNASEDIKQHVEKVATRPMFEERRWGTYKVINTTKYSDGFCTLTKELKLNAGCNISYQIHRHRDEVWTFVNGHGLLVIDNEVTEVSRGSVVHIKKGQLHAVKAITDLEFIEVQTGDILVEEDIERYEWEWK